MTTIAFTLSSIDSSYTGTSVDGCVFVFAPDRNRDEILMAPGVAKLENRCAKPQSLKSWTQSIPTSLSKDTLLLLLSRSPELLAGSLFRA